MDATGAGLFGIGIATEAIHLHDSTRLVLERGAGVDVPVVFLHQTPAKEVTIPGDRQTVLGEEQRQTFAGPLVRVGHEVVEQHGPWLDVDTI